MSMDKTRTSIMDSFKMAGGSIKALKLCRLDDTKILCFFGAAGLLITSAIWNIALSLDVKRAL